MKNILTTLAVILLIVFSAKSQEAVQLVDFDNQTDTILVMETNIWKVTALAGDSTSLVEYFYRGQKEKVNAYAEDSLLIDGSMTRFLNPDFTGLTSGVNADNIEGAYKVTDTTSGFWYNEGNLRKKYSLGISLDSLKTLINAL